MWNRHDVHKMFINIYRNPKTRNWFRYENLIHLFEFKDCSTWGQRDTIFLCWLLLHRQLSTQPTGGARSAQICLASPSSESRLSLSEAGTQLSAFLKFQKSSLTLPVHDVIHTPWFYFYLGFYFDICEWRILPACVWTPALMFAPN